MARVIHFDIMVKNADRAIGFYREVFGWRIEKWDGPMEYWLISTGDGVGIDGGMAVGEPAFKEPALTLGVDDANAVCDLAEKNGGNVVRRPSPVQGVGHLATVEDTEGNQFGLMQDDPNA